MKTLLIVACLLVSSSVFAECATNARGKTVCTQGEKAAGYNAKTGNAAVAQKNQNGVTTTKTSQGGEAKTKNGMGVAKGANGEVCAKGKNKQGCKKG